jgi:hypothetical protein
MTNEDFSNNAENATRIIKPHSNNLFVPYFTKSGPSMKSAPNSSGTSKSLYVPENNVFFSPIRHICYGLLVCTACIYAYRFVCDPMSFKGRNHGQKQSKCKILMLFPYQNVTLFRMGHLIFL